MPGHKYSASLSQTQGRSGFSIIFRHPVRHDEATGKPGVRVRRGLSTRDRAEAEKLRDQLNEILRNERYHEPAAREEAEHRFDSRVVEIFYYKMIPEELDFAEIREVAIPLPTAEDSDYRRVLLLGTTGAGKTTLVRQLIGTDPVKERFPSTSTAKTTVHDTEIVLDEGPWRAIVTFISIDELREYLNECISAAVLAARRGEQEGQVLQRLLSHVNQRYRFNYVLGNGPELVVDEEEEDEDEEEQTQSGLFTPDELGKVDLDTTNRVLERSVDQIRDLAHRLGEKLKEDLQASDETDNRVLDEIFEEEIDNLLHEDEVAHSIADELLDEIEKRFDLLPAAELSRTKQGWPLAWKGLWESDERESFLKAISRFSSNYAPLFGRLLTPLVNGVRVAGPFCPDWTGGRQPRLVLLDGEGLGHTPKSSAAISTSVSHRIEEADAVLLVDSAAQPMQAAPVAAMRELASTGKAKKLLVAFTHFDEVKGDNLPKFSDKERHVLESVENVLRSVGEELGPFAERVLRKRIAEGRFFFGRIHEPLDGRKADKRTIRQLNLMLEAIDEIIAPPAPGQARPVYDRMNLVLAVRAAAERFHDAWFPLLGLDYRPGIVKEHWTRIKALARRLAFGMRDEYDNLKPVASLRTELQDRVYVFIQNPVKWEGSEPVEDEKQVIYDTIADSIAGRVRQLATSRVWKERMGEWQNAYGKRGKGSTFVRAHIIGEQIYDQAAPVPAAVPSPNRNEFLRLVTNIVDEVCEEYGARLK